MDTIFNYTDYRKYLSDALAERKRENRHFSYRFLSQHLNLKSSGFMHRVLKGQKKLPELLIPKIATLFKLDEHETAYLHILVKFNHSTNATERGELFKKLEGFVGHETARHLHGEQYSLFTRWFYVAIREMLRMVPFSNNFHALAASFQPKIKISEARTAIRTLEKIGLIKRGEDGFYHALESQVTTGDRWESELIKNLQIQFAEMGKNAIITIPKQQRDISNLTFCASETTMRMISDDIAALRLKILALSDSDQQADILYQCNLQLFPIGRKTRETSNEP